MAFNSCITQPNCGSCLFFPAKTKFADGTRDEIALPRVKPRQKVGALLLGYRGRAVALLRDIDAAKVPGHRGHGTDLFKVHPESPGIIVQRPERFGAEVRGKTIGNADSHAALCHPGQTWSSGEGRFAAV